MRWLAWMGSCIMAQTLLTGRAIGSTGEVVGADTVLSGGPIVLRFSLPTGWQKDTFIAVIRNALGPVSRTKLIPHPSYPSFAYGRCTLARAGFYLLTVHHPRAGSRLWAHRRLYILAPPYTTIGQVRAYHNALLAQASSKTSPPPSEPSLEKELEALHLPLANSESLSITLTEEDLHLPELGEIDFSREPIGEEETIEDWELDD
ncbi:MAG: hypothetical protein N2170_07995 [Bacteroidia bacterium]|nr:hypothetical protein [Bacteroidia bacterium]